MSTSQGHKLPGFVPPKIILRANNFCFPSSTRYLRARWPAACLLLLSSSRHFILVECSTLVLMVTLHIASTAQLGTSPPARGAATRTIQYISYIHGCIDGPNSICFAALASHMSGGVFPDQHRYIPPARCAGEHSAELKRRAVRVHANHSTRKTSSREF